MHKQNLFFVWVLLMPSYYYVHLEEHQQVHFFCAYFYNTLDMTPAFESVLRSNLSKENG